MSADVERITPAEALARMAAGWIYVDVRTPEEFALGHPRGAYNVPFELLAPEGMRENPAFVRVVRARFDGASIVVGCKSGGRSRRACEALRAAGVGSALADQHAGWDGARGAFGEVLEAGWQRLDLPADAGAPGGRAYADLATLSGP